MNPLMRALDLELERCGWKARSRAWDEACRATLANDGPAFRKAMDEFHREQTR
jgi:hypothetical protein